MKPLLRALAALALTAFAVSAAADTAAFEDLRKSYESASKGTPAWQRAALAYGKLAHHLRKFATAKRVLGEYAAAAPEGPDRTAAMALVEEIRGRFKVDRTVGVLLPLSGPFRRYGSRVKDGIELAAERFPGLALKFKDTRGEPGLARKAVEDLVLQDHVIALIGPIGENESHAAAQVAERFQVPILTLTRREGMTELGSYVFRNYLTNKMQGQAMARYAVQVLGLRRFAILYPNTRYGDENMRAFWDEVVRLGGSIRAVERYSPHEREHQEPVKKLVGAYWLELRPDMWKEANKRQFGRSYRARKRKWDYAQKNIRPIVDFDAIFLPDFWNRLVFVLPWLKYFDIEFFTDNVVRLDRLKLKYGKKLPKLVWLLGTNGWNSDKLHKRIGDFVWRAVFCDAVFRGSDRAPWTTFSNLYHEKYGRAPQFLPAIGFDSMRIIQEAVKKGAATREALRDELRKLKDFPGATGKTTFANGDVEKELYVLSIERSKADVNKYEIQPAKMQPREVAPETDTDAPSEEGTPHDDQAPPRRKTEDRR